MKSNEKPTAPCNEKAIADAILRFASKSGRDPIQTWNEWLEWLCGVFEESKMDFSPDSGNPLEVRLQWAKEDNPDFFEAAVAWAEYSYGEMKWHGPTDALGTIYEKCFQSAAKASHTGQYFTPMHICKLMANVVGPATVGDDGIVKWNDPAAGSGRLLIAGWGVADKYAKNFFEGGDIDATSVRMAALNMMINGMVGTVHCQDCLSREWRFGYIVNACKVPFANDFTEIELVSDEKVMNAKRHRLLELMKDWDVGRYRPEAKTSANDTKRRYTSEEEKLEAPEQPTKPQVVKPTQQELQL